MLEKIYELLEEGTQKQKKLDQIKREYQNEYDEIFNHLN